MRACPRHTPFWQREVSSKLRPLLRAIIADRVVQSCQPLGTVPISLVEWTRVKLANRTRRLASVRAPPFRSPSVRGVGFERSTSVLDPIRHTRGYLPAVPWVHQKHR